eukprot:TRINITY_DN4492_c0_g2_i2.p1 TRINITY_DN4492_c0_g2~~TRINITY_DN4492_c0_g2_i2.p1  ORF type:complete len:212 (+),score=76.31 TRINITY_DN4492_c0_g2_i2:69-638(+)
MADEEKKAEEAPKETYDGVVQGKYQWDNDTAGKKSADDDASQAITKYSWSDGKKTVSIYVELDGLDDVAEDALKASSGEKEASLTISAIGSPPRKRVLKLSGLLNEIDGVKLTQKKGKNTVVLKLQKKEEQPWHNLLEKSSGGGGDDDEGGGMPGGMDMASMMGGMGGMGGMDMASMMGGMGGMGGMGM